MRDLLSAAASSVNCRGGVNGDQPTEISRADVDDIEAALLGGDARTLLHDIEAQDKFGTGPIRDAFIALANTDVTKDLQQIDGWLNKVAYPGNQMNLMQEEYGSVSRFRFFVSSRGAKEDNASLNGNNVYLIPMYGVEAFAKIEQNNYSARIGYHPPYLVSRVEQNGALWAKFAIARAITNQSWITLLRCTLSRSSVL